jgi:rod shape-determining protein MreC
MHRWWDKRSLQTTFMVLALGLAWSIAQTKAGIFNEIYYFIVSPFQSDKQLLLEDKLTNARILELEQRLAELERQNQQFKQLLDEYDPEDHKQIAAPIIGRSTDRWWHQVMLGKGSEDGIKEGFIVMGIGGLVGRITQVTPHTSKVLLISDAQSRVGAVVSRNRHLGFVKGRDDGTLTMDFFAKVADIKPGDAISTSPLSKLYPPGLPIGKIASVQSDSSPAPSAEIKLAAPIELLEWVVVRPFQPPSVREK